MGIIPSIITATVAILAFIFSCVSLMRTKKAQMQNINVQLFDRRYKVYDSLKNWCDKINNVFIEDTEDRYGKILAFRGEMLNYLEDEKLLFYSSKLRKYDNMIKNLSDTEQRKIRTKQRTIYQEKCAYIIISAKKMKRKIDMGTYLFSLDVVDVRNIKKITNTFFDITKEIFLLEERGDVPKTEQEKSLNKNFEALREMNNGVGGLEKILGKMECQLGELGKSFLEQ